MKNTLLKSALLPCLTIATSLACGSEDTTCIDGEAAQPCAADEATAGGAEALDDVQLVVNKAQWQKMTFQVNGQDGVAVDIGAGLAGNDKVWLIGNPAIGTGSTIYQYNIAQNKFLAGPQLPNGLGAKRIAVTVESGLPWVVASNNSVYERTSGGAWVQHAGICAQDIGLGGGGTDANTAWIIGCESSDPNRIYEWSFSQNQWKITDEGYGTRITVDSGGTPWVVPGNHSIFSYNATTPTAGAHWTRRANNNSAQDIGGGPPIGGAYRVVLSAMDEEIKQWDGSSFQTLLGYGTNVATNTNGTAYAIAHVGTVWKL